MCMASNLPYCMVLICDIQIVGSLVPYQKTHSYKKYRNSSGNGEDTIFQLGGGKKCSPKLLTPVCGEDTGHSRLYGFSSE